MKKIVFALVSFLLFSCEKTKEKEQLPFEDLTSIIDQYALNTLKKGNSNSLAIAVYRDGKMYHNYYGEIDKGLNNAPNDSTLYEVASISKVFAGSLAAKAVLEGKFALDDDIRKYLGGDFSNLEYKGKPITIKNLLTHTLGFKNKTPKKLQEVNRKTFEGYYESRPFDYDINDFLQELKTVKLDKEPGTHYDYNSVGPELIAYILEQVYHKKYSDMLEAFFEELGMKNTYLQNYDLHKKQLANGYDENKKRSPLDKNPLLGGAYGMITTLPDLAKFMKFQLESKNPLVKESSRFLFKDDENEMGYLWDVGIGKKEGFYYSKTGTSFRIQSGVLVCPDSHYGLVLIVNNKSDASLKDWENLYNKIENDLIHFPKINLVSLLQTEFSDHPEKAFEKYKKLEKDTIRFSAGSAYLNEFGYQMLYENQISKAIAIFKLAISQDLKNANLYDSLGEAYYLNKDYKNALLNYKQSLLLNPKNENAKKFIVVIEDQF